jgi:hypothetical protein
MHQEQEVTNLESRQDFRHPRYRREVFLRFYEFHLVHRTHPGCVYFAFPWLQETFKLDAEQMLWLAFINGNTQNIITSFQIYRAFPDFRRLTCMALKDWFDEHYTKLLFDTDRRYHKKDFVRSVECYRKLTEGDQSAYFRQFTEGRRPTEAFDLLWKEIRSKFFTFGRLSAFSYTEYLRLVGVDIECPTLFLDDMDGSKSHRNGLAKVLGRDDLDWHTSTRFEGKYAPEQVAWLSLEAAQLLVEARERMADVPDVDIRHVHYHTIESAFCTFKSWFRPNRRYPNCYADMMHDRIKYAEEKWGKGWLTNQFWQMRRDCLPIHLRQEDNPNDPGLTPRKQNHFRETGKPIMMSRRWECFDNSFDRECWS